MITSTQPTITTNQAAAMCAAQDAAAKSFWAYPDGHWQENFQAHWLSRQYGVCGAIDSEGLVWGDIG